MQSGWYDCRVALKVKTIARQAAEDALAASLRSAITAQLTEELNRVFSEPPIKECWHASFAMRSLTS